MMKRIKKQFDELRFFWLFGLLVVTVALFTVFFGNV
jgi:hypothetical protein